MDEPDSDTDWVIVGDLKEAVMQRFIYRQNLAEHFRERLAEAADEAERERLLKLFDRRRRRVNAAGQVRRF